MAVPVVPPYDDALNRLSDGLHHLYSGKDTPPSGSVLRRKVDGYA
jgi:hypothetical protein